MKCGFCKSWEGAISNFKALCGKTDKYKFFKDESCDEFKPRCEAPPISYRRQRFLSYNRHEVS